jgi:lipopolysaccharide export system protein LptC
LWAKAAIQDLANPDQVELRTLRAKVMMEDKSTVTMDARTGFFDSKQQMLDLRKDIFLQSSTGYEAKLTQAHIDINKGSVTSDEHVDVKLLNGTLSADKLRIIDSGDVVRFEGNVVMNLVMESPPAPEPEPEPPPPPKTRSVTGKSANTK